jgi:hypothetical protein
MLLRQILRPTILRRSCRMLLRKLIRHWMTCSLGWGLMKVRLLDELMHDGQPYDPLKAHEYYLKNRELKGRQPGAQQDLVGRPGGAGNTGVVAPTGSPAKQPPVHKTAADVQSEADAAVAALQKRLTALRAVLAALVKEAQTRSGVTSNATTKATAAAKSHPETSAQKAKASAAAKAYYEKHKADTDADKTKLLNQQIKDVQAKIKKMRETLAAAAKKAKTTKVVKKTTKPVAKKVTTKAVPKTTPKPAPKPTTKRAVPKKAL